MEEHPTHYQILKKADERTQPASITLTFSQFGVLIDALDVLIGAYCEASEADITRGYRAVGSEDNRIARHLIEHINHAMGVCDVTTGPNHG